MLFNVFLTILFLTLGAWLFYTEFKKPKEGKEAPPYSLDLDVHIHIDKEGKVNTQVNPKSSNAKSSSVIPIEESSKEDNWLNINPTDSN